MVVFKGAFEAYKPAVQIRVFESLVKINEGLLPKGGRKWCVLIVYRPENAMQVLIAWK